MERTIRLVINRFCVKPCLFTAMDREMHASFDDKEFEGNIKTPERLVQISIKASLC